VLENLDTTIGYPREKLRLLDNFRRMRSAGLYDGSFEPSTAEVQALLDAVTELKAHLDEWLANNYPELSEKPT